MLPPPSAGRIRSAESQLPCGLASLLAGAGGRCVGVQPGFERPGEPAGTKANPEPCLDGRGCRFTWERAREIPPALSIPSAQDHDSAPSETSSQPIARNVVTAPVQGTTDSPAPGAPAAPKGATPDQPPEDGLVLTPPEQLTDTAPAVQSGELAFAARLTPGETAPDSNGARTPNQDPPVQDLGEPRVQVPSQSLAGPADNSSSPSSASPQTDGQGGKIETAALPEQFTRAESFTREEATPSQAPTAGDPPDTPGDSSKKRSGAHAGLAGGAYGTVDRAASGACEFQSRLHRSCARHNRARHGRPICGSRWRNSWFLVRTGDAELAQTLRSGLS